MDIDLVMSDGTRKHAQFTNHGWQNGHYLSEYIVNGQSILCRFKAAYCNVEHCHYPELRLSFERERLDHELGAKGQYVCDIDLL